MRFTLKTLLSAIAVSAVLCCVFFTLPAVLAVCLLGAVWVFIPPALIAGIVYGRGYGRAFSIGCVAAGGCLPLFWLYASFSLVSVFGDLTNITIDNNSAAYAKLGFGASFLVIGMSGLVSMSVRWLSLRLAPPQPEPVAVAGQSYAPADYAVLQRRVTTLPPNPGVKPNDREPTDEED